MSNLSPEPSEKPYWPSLNNQFMENQIPMIPLLAGGFFYLIIRPLKGVERYA